MANIFLHGCIKTKIMTTFGIIITALLVIGACICIYIFFLLLDSYDKKKAKTLASLSSRVSRKKQIRDMNAQELEAEYKKILLAASKGEKYDFEDVQQIQRMYKEITGLNLKIKF